MKTQGYANHLFPVSVLSAAAILISACASQPPPGDETIDSYTESFDPIEPVNRAIFGFNIIVDDYLVRPVAKVYRAALPGRVRDSIRNLLRNTSAPVILANDLLQGETSRAKTTAVRFVINTGIGVAGLFDPAEGMGYAYHDEDLGQTLAVYGAGEGLYLVIPILGPSNLRDVIGLAGDAFLNPLTYVADNNDAEEWLLARAGVGGIDLRARNIDTLDELKRESIDFYARIRSLYRQRRQFEIDNGEITLPAPGLVD